MAKQICAKDTVIDSCLFFGPKGYWELEFDSPILKWFLKTNKFDVINTGEGKNLFMGVQKNKIFITNIDMVIICLVHEENTIPKEHFNDTNDNSPSLDEKIVEFIETILPP